LSEPRVGPKVAYVSLRAVFSLSYLLSSELYPRIPDALAIRAVHDRVAPGFSSSGRACPADETGTAGQALPDGGQSIVNRSRFLSSQQETSSEAFPSRGVVPSCHEEPGEEDFMKSKRVVAPLLISFLASTSVGLLSGCEAGSGQIPLANVPPPPEGFTANKNVGKVPSTASPTDANARRK
jgi:hypothetical protein